MPESTIHGLTMKQLNDRAITMAETAGRVLWRSDNKQPMTEYEERVFRLGIAHGVAATYRLLFQFHVIHTDPPVPPQFKEGGRVVKAADHPNDWTATLVPRTCSVRGTRDTPDDPVLSGCTDPDCPQHGGPPCECERVHGWWRLIPDCPRHGQTEQG